MSAQILSFYATIESLKVDFFAADSPYMRVRNKHQHDPEYNESFVSDENILISLFQQFRISSEEVIIVFLYHNLSQHLIQHHQYF